jgi:hypothetical protein
MREDRRKGSGVLALHARIVSTSDTTRNAVRVAFSRQAPPTWPPRREGVARPWQQNALRGHVPFAL